MTMAWFTEFLNCKTGEMHSTYRSTSIRYCDSSGREFETPQGCAWCTNCTAIVNAESFELQIPSKIKTARIALSDPDSKEAFLFGNAENAKHAIENLNAIHEFLKGRESGRRCLECYFDTIIDLPDSDEFTTPDGSLWKRHTWGHASMKSEPNILLDREGSPIAG